VTVAIAVITGSGKHIVTASDRMISAEGVIPAADDAMIKQRRIGKAWGLLFAANDANLFLPIVRNTIKQFDQEVHRDLQTVQDAVSSSYVNIYDTEFTSRYLRRYNIWSVTSFLNSGIAQFGVERFSSICDQMESFDLGVEILGYGFDKDGTAHIF
jgi:hypothetical protein